MTSRAHTVTGPIYKLGINRCLDVPDTVSEDLGSEKHVPVLISIGPHSARTTLMPAGDGRHRVFLTGALRHAAGVDAGEVIRLDLRRDPDGWSQPLPTELAEAFEHNETARDAFYALTPAKQREVVRFVDRAKQAATREKRVDRTLEMLADLAFDS